MDKKSRRLTLHFGRDSAWELPQTDAIASFLKPDIEPLTDLPAAIASALSNPLDFPPMDQAVVAGDRLVFAVDPTIPALPQVMAELAAFYHAHGTPPHNIQIVLADLVPNQPAAVAAAVEARLGSSASVAVHDPDDQNLIAYVAADEQAQAIYVNRQIVDADVVVPVICGRAPDGLDDLGACSLFPLLSDRATRAKFYTLAQLENTQTRYELSGLADQAAWWTGFLTTVQIVPAGGDQVGAVLAGDSQAVHDACRKQMLVSWGTPTVASELTIALLGGGDSQQSWLGFARAFYAGLHCTRPGGTLVVCTDVDREVWQCAGQLQEADLAAEYRVLREAEASEDSGRNPAWDEDSGDDGAGGDGAGAMHAAERVEGDAEYEASFRGQETCWGDQRILADLIHQATRDRHVYLVSQLPRDSVESLGMGVIQDASELSRLVDRAGSCVILGDAQFRFTQDEGKRQP